MFERLPLGRVKAALGAGKHEKMNMIPYIAVDGLGFRRPSWERAAAIGRSLNRRCILAHLHRLAGQDLHVGCGHLRVGALASGACAIAIVPAA